MTASQQILRDRLVALSVSDNEDLLELGFSEMHLNDACLRLSRALLSRGASIAYGGVLGVGDLTATVHDIARYELRGHPSTERDTRLETPFINYQPWPLHRNVTRDREIRERGICKYIRVDDRDDPGKHDANAPLPAARLAHALSRMRRWMAAESDGRVVIGGKVSGFLGIMPGILEEALFQLEVTTPDARHSPLFIAGGYGGAAKALSDAILRSADTDPCPASLVEAERDGESEMSDLIHEFPDDAATGLVHDVSRSEAEQSYSRLQEQVARIRSIGLEDGLQNGLGCEENERLMRSENPEEIARFVCRGLEKIYP